MSDERLSSVLLDIGLPAREVEELVDRYDKMRVNFQQGDYEKAGVDIGKFGEGMVKLLQLEADRELRDEGVRNFAQRYLNGRTDANVSDRVKKRIPHMLHIGWSIRSNQDAAHLHFDKPVRKADIQLGIRLCSSMLIELVREFANEDDDLDIDEVTELLQDLSEPVEQNPLHSLVQSRTEFDRQRVADAIDGYVVIVEEGSVEQGPNVSGLSKHQELAAFGLGRLAAYSLGRIDDIGANADWYDDRVAGNVNDGTIQSTKYFLHDEGLGGHYVPGYKATEAISRLSDK